MRIFSCCLSERVCVALLLLSVAVGCTHSEMQMGSPSGIAPDGYIAPEGLSRIHWLKYYEALGAASRGKGDTLMLYFMMDSCSPCKLMEKRTFNDERVVEALDEFVPVRVRGDVELQMIRRFRVRTFPTIVFASVKEGEIDRKVGYRNADFLLDWVQEVKAGRTTFKALSGRLERDPADLQALLEQAHNLVDADEIDNALQLAQKAADIAVGDADVLALFGLCHFRVDKLTEAEAAIDAALRADDRNREARSLKVALLLRKADDALADNDTDMAMGLFAAALTREPDSFDALMASGRFNMKMGENEAARAQFQRAAFLRPGSAAPCIALGDLHQQMGNPVMAERDFLQAIDVDPRYEAPYFRLMELYETNGRPDDLMGMYEKVLSLEPAGAHNEIAWLMATSKHAGIYDPISAVEHATAAVELEPYAWYIDTLAESYYAGGDYDLAIAIIREAMAKEPDDFEYYRTQLEKFQQAKEHALNGEGQNRE